MLSVDGLSKRFAIPKPGLFGGYSDLHALSDVSFAVNEGETLGIVGESGCGKSTLGRSILRLIEPDAGRVTWRGERLSDLSPEAMRLRRRDMQIIFQDPIASLDPRMTVGAIIGEPLTIFARDLSADERKLRVFETMEAVGLLPEMINRYPHEFSGGQAQRIGIARAIVTRPKLIVCDEPVSALDVSIQAQIINLLKDLRAQFGLTLILISHDLSVVRLISDRIMVLYLGRVVEIGSTRSVFENPAHPYTKALLAAAPVPDPVAARAKKRAPLEGDLPSPIDLPSGCVFRTRCPIAVPDCAKAIPDFVAIGENHLAACPRVDL